MSFDLKAMEDGAEELIRIIGGGNQDLLQINSSYIYHYCNYDTVPLILDGSHVSLKMTEINNFADKLEGRRTVLKYYKKAIDELKEEKKISEELYERIQDIELSKTSIYITNLSDTLGSFAQAKMCAYNTFVSCFSVLENSDYLMNKYIKRIDKKGYCMGFFVQSMLDNCSDARFNLGFPIILVPVIYGKDIVNYIKRAVLKMLNNEFFLAICRKTDNQNSIIRLLLDDLRFRIKSEKYALEKEVRVFAKVPINYSNEKEELIVRNPTDKNNIDCLLRLEKNVLRGINKSPAVTDSEDQEMKEKMIDRGYPQIKYFST